MPAGNHVMPDNDPLWYKDAVIYEVHVRAFFDSSGDGMGDFVGLTQKLDYLQDLGVTALWLLPFCPSPWKDDGYDISNYTDVHPAYGTLRDFQQFVREAKRRGLHVITELVLNHTSDQHVWFQRSRRAQPGTRWRNYYVWSDTAEKYREARIIFKDFETSNWTWDPIAKAYFWHRFYSHQPDLNYDNPEVRAAMFDAVDFWLDAGVDGLRLDAVPYLYEREGTSCENLSETHEALKELRAHVDQKYRGRMLLAEANQWPEDAVAYFGAGDECNMAFHFPLMPRLFMSIRMEDRYPVTEILQLTPPAPENGQWALFLRNHDELTLEMVTDEERDYMYRVYAQDRHMRINLGIRRRLAPLLENDRRRMELMNALLFSLPGTPVVYYGDEIGMGDNFYLGDRNGVRTPMQWSSDRNAGFSRANPQSLYLPVIIDPEYHYEAVNVENQLNNPHSLLWWMKRMIALRKQSKAFGRGDLRLLFPDNRRVFAFLRSYDDENILVVANLSRFTQYAEIPLAEFQGMTPVEMFGRTDFPPISDKPYFISLGPHAFNWFVLERRAVAEVIEDGAEPGRIPVFPVASWQTPLGPETRRAMTVLLPSFLRQRRWFLSRSRPIRSAGIQDVIPFPRAESYLLILRVEYSQGEPENYLVPLSIARGEAAIALEEKPQFVMARLQGPDGSRGVLYSALRNPAFCNELVGVIARRRRFPGEHGELTGAHTRAFRPLYGGERQAMDPVPAKADQRNSSVIFGDRFVLKLIRRVEPGSNPEREVGELLTPQTPRVQVAPLAGSLEYRGPGAEPMTVAVLHGYERNETHGWQYTLDNLGLFFAQAQAVATAPDAAVLAPKPLIEIAGAQAPELARQLTGSYLEMIRLLGQRTAEIHAALASEPENPAFAPEPYTDFYRHSLYHGMIGHAGRVLAQLRRSLNHLPAEAEAHSRRLIDNENSLREKLKQLRDRRIQAVRIRNHGDFHLGQVLYTGRDWIVIDFEGDPERPLSERRIKRSPLTDAAGMLRSLHYASQAVLYGQVPGVVPVREAAPSLSVWANFWYRWSSAAFLGGYLDVPAAAALLPSSRDDLRLLLECFLIDKAIREVEYELNHRPDWVLIPVLGLLELVETALSRTDV